MTEFTDWITSEIQNWEFRVEDILLHMLTGLFMGITIKIKKIFTKIKHYFSHIF